MLPWLSNQFTSLKTPLQVPVADNEADPDKESLDILALIAAEARRIREAKAQLQGMGK